MTRLLVIFIMFVNIVTMSRLSETVGLTTDQQLVKRVNVSRITSALRKPRVCSPLLSDTIRKYLTDFYLPNAITELLDSLYKLISYSRDTARRMLYFLEVKKLCIVDCFR